MKHWIRKITALVITAGMILVMMPAIALAQNQTGIVTGSAVNVRATPGGAVLCCLRRNSKVEILGTEGRYYKVQLPGGSTVGYMYSQYVTVETASDGAFNTNQTLQLGSRGADIAKVQTRLKELGYFTYPSVTEYYGTATQAAVKAFQAAQGLGQTGIADPATLAALMGGDAASSPQPTAAVTPVPGETAAPVDGVTVQVPGQYGSLRNNICLRRGCRGADVKDLQNALAQKGFYSGTVDGVFGTSTQQAVMCFQRSLGLDADGLAGNYTLSALYSLLAPLSQVDDLHLDTASGVKAEMLTWTQASAALPRGTTFIVVDVLTGRSFRAYRSGGTYHADVEPLTATDTNIFYSIYGKWSWARRPIWVVYNGRRLAASMNGMPHGTGYIDGNDMVGQFCIHFSGSRTHGTLRVDPLHKAAIQQAYDAGQ